MSPRAVYVDSSAIVKLIEAEPESADLRGFVAGRALVSCAIAHTEVLRAVRGRGPAVERNARETLGAIDLVTVDGALLEEAAQLHPDVLRTLDAIHIAAAVAVRADLDAVVTYDVRMAEAARLVSFEVTTPGRST